MCLPMHMTGLCILELDPTGNAGGCSTGWSRACRWEEWIEAESHRIPSAMVCIVDICFVDFQQSSSLTASWIILIERQDEATEVCITVGCWTGCSRDFA